MSDGEVFDTLRFWADMPSGYQVIQHGNFTKTELHHVHIGRFPNGSRQTEFKVKGSPEGQG